MEAYTKKQRKALERRAMEVWLSEHEISGSGSWGCCEEQFKSIRDIRGHVWLMHEEALRELALNVAENVRFREDNNVSPYWRRKQVFEPDADAQEEGMVVLFYRYTDVVDIKGVCRWHWDLCERTSLRGKIRIAEEGINCTLSGATEAIEEYLLLLKEQYHYLFSQTHFKKSPGKRDEFSGLLSVKECAEICPLGLPYAEHSDINVENGAMHLSPDQFHEFIVKAEEEAVKQEAQGDATDFQRERDREKETVLLDCRNAYEWTIGRFQSEAVPTLLPPTRRFSDFPSWTQQHADELKNKNILMYCTGGIRCERASAVVRKYVGEESDVYQLQGGIHNYIESHPVSAAGEDKREGGEKQQRSYWRGKNYVFDNRWTQPAPGYQQDIVAKCDVCSGPFDSYSKCANDPACQELVLCCGGCRKSRAEEAEKLRTVSSLLESYANGRRVVVADNNSGKDSDTREARVYCCSLCYIQHLPEDASNCCFSCMCTAARAHCE